MTDFSVTLCRGGAVRLAGYAGALQLGYTKNRGVYRLKITAADEWKGLTIRCFWHRPGGSDPPGSLVQDGTVEVPASVTAAPGDGCITFEGSDGTCTVTSADLHYHVGANSGTEDGSLPEPDTPAWEAFLAAAHDDLKGDPGPQGPKGDPGTSYTLPAATASALGGVKVGSGLSVTTDGTLSADAQEYSLPTASYYTLGGIRIGSNLSMDSYGRVSAPDPYTLTKTDIIDKMGYTPASVTAGTYDLTAGSSYLATGTIYAVYE